MNGLTCELKNKQKMIRRSHNQIKFVSKTLEMNENEVKQTNRTTQNLSESNIQQENGKIRPITVNN